MLDLRELDFKQSQFSSEVDYRGLFTQLIRALEIKYPAKVRQLQALALKTMLMDDRATSRDIAAMKSMFGLLSNSWTMFLLEPVVAALQNRTALARLMFEHCAPAACATTARERVPYTALSGLGTVSVLCTLSVLVGRRLYVVGRRAVRADTFLIEAMKDTACGAVEGTPPNSAAAWTPDAPKCRH